MADYQVICRNCGRRLDADTARCLCGADVHDAPFRARRSALKRRVGRLLASSVIVAAAVATAGVLYANGDVERLRVRVSEATGLSDRSSQDVASEAPLRAPTARPSVRQPATPVRGSTATPPPTAIPAGLSMPPLTPLPNRR